MKPSQVSESLKHLIKIKRPFFLWGPVGVGKSDVVRSVASDLKLELRDVRLNLVDPVDLKGFPVVGGTAKTKSMNFVPPSFLPTKGEGILFFDEMNSATQAVQAAAYQLILDRKLGDYELPPGWSIGAAGNRARDRAVVHSMPSALANRFVHVDYEVDVEDWYTWALKNDVSDLTRGFIRANRDLLHAHDASKNERAFPTPRSWVFADQLANSGLTPDTEYELVKGTVGEGAAAVYLAHSRMHAKLPTAEEILLNPDSAPVPDEPSAMWAVCSSLDKVATATSFPRLIKYAERLPKEFQVLFVRSAATLERSITRTKEYIAWVTANQDVLL